MLTYADVCLQLALGSAYLRTYETHALKEAAERQQTYACAAYLRTYETHALKEAAERQQTYACAQRGSRAPADIRMRLTRQ
jgi:hypothetical protein